MIKYINCSSVDIQKTYEAFQIGFSDYMIRLDVSYDDFMKRFFGPEGNQIENSFIALDDEEPVGVILGGIKIYESIRTIRCGTLCIHPDYRGKGVSQELFRLHKELAMEKGCQQLFLEVIAENHRAIKFYKNLGYDSIYDLSYFGFSDIEAIKKKTDPSIIIQKIDLETFSSVYKRANDVHINWQNDLEYIEKLGIVELYGKYEGEEAIGAVAVSPNGKIMFLYVDPLHRGRGIGRAFVNKAICDLNLEKVNISFPNNASLQGFVKRCGFKRDPMGQYEMYLTL